MLPGLSVVASVHACLLILLSLESQAYAGVSEAQTVAAFLLVQECSPSAMLATRSNASEVQPASC